MEEKAPVNDFVRTVPGEKYYTSITGNGVIFLLLQLRCHCNPDHGKFHPYLIQLWWQFFQMSVYGNVFYAQTWQVLS